MPKLPTLQLKHKLPALLVGFTLMTALVVQAFAYAEFKRQAMQMGKSQIETTAMAHENAIRASFRFHQSGFNQLYPGHKRGWPG